MALNLDPQTPVEKSIGGVTYLIRVLTQREMMRFAAHSEAIRARCAQGGPDEPTTLDEAEIRRLEKCLCIGIGGWSNPEGADTFLPPWRAGPDGPRTMAVELLDAVPFTRWMEIYLAVVEANAVTETDSKNSPSPPQ